MNKIFLSASIPLPDRDPKYIGTADISAIRDAVNALAKVVIPNAILVWGGHPSITPLIRVILEKLKIDVSKHVVLYQSEFFNKIFPADNEQINCIKLINEIKDNKDESLALMRKEMIEGNDFIAGIFIGGMEGVEDEFKLFKQYHPDALLLPVATTGAAALSIYQASPENYMEELNTDYAYMALFTKLLKGKI
ncbi:hypothetical protein J3U68_00535 [Snodgrassella sp. B3882]|uniref:SLOG domain-containing protein n=1 Tax=Snodgrassella sp. B3882 TaxID=2818037 RepID=UPI00226A0225|nr:hypothetical protein [Snodgrassella sp. B3882]MCX8743899.1 hypothetical protein [Snodgrassella sp. B3882]